MKLVIHATKRKEETYEETAHREKKTIELDSFGPSSREPCRNETDKREGGRVDLDQ